MKKVHIKNIAKLIELRELLNTELYSGHALITYDLILVVLKAHLESRNLTIKELCTGSIRSTLNTRKHINLLIDDGWIVLSNDVHDKRHRLVNTTDKLINLVDRLLDSSLAGSNSMNKSMHS
jgi:DNA-binding MarR family transcriptional regulator